MFLGPFFMNAAFEENSAALISWQEEILGYATCVVWTKAYVILFTTPQP